ncbi:MAG TPA: WD40 repeat domain-containing protein [Methylibium sp.]|nr:WD40 repeat domain-containing protein [Methylibium sp.]
MNTPLLDVLGVQWDLQAPIVAVAWDDAGGTAAYAMGDGRVALAAAQWRAGPRVERRDVGGVHVLPGMASTARPSVVTCHAGSCHALAADGAGGFVSGGDDGRVVRVRADATPEELSRMPGVWIDAVACNGAGATAYAGGRRVARHRASGIDEIELPASATDMAFSPDGATLAMAHSDGVTLWNERSLPRRLTWPGYHRKIAWSPDGRYVFTGMQENAIHGWRVADGGDMEMAGYPGQPLSLAFTHDAALLVTSGALRPVCWDLARPGSSQAPRECGIRSKAPVSCVTCHPRRHVIATGHHSGAITLCTPDSDGFLLLKGAGGGAQAALAWSPDGQRLAFGTHDGVLGWLDLPDALFCSERRPADTNHPQKEARHEQ